MMRFARLARLAAAALLLCFGAWGHVLAAEVIHSFDSTVQLAKDGELTVTERIRVRAEGLSIKRGIFRDFPLTFTDAQGGRHEVSFTLLDVTRDGQPEPHSTERLSGNTDVLRIYAGDKNTLLAPGEHTYVIRYRTARQVRWFDGAAELNWNVTGNFWDFPILAASYRLELADNAQPARWKAFTGLMGADGNDYSGAIGVDGALTVAATRPLDAREGLTVVAALPESAVAPPSRASELWYLLADNRAWLFGGVGFLLVLGYFLAAWNAVGRDPKPGAIIPLFYPPKGISPSLANYIENWGLGREKWRAFTAAALSLAVQGLVRFDDSSGALTLKATGKNPESGAPLGAGEGAIMGRVNALGGIFIINQANGEKVARAGDAFTAAIEVENRNRFFRRNLGYFGVGMLLSAAVLFAVVTYGGLSDIQVMVMLFGGVACLSLGGFLGAFIKQVTGGVTSFAMAMRTALALIMLGAFGMAAYAALRELAPNGLLSALPVALHFLGQYLLPIFLVGGFAALNGLFLYLMRAPTALGRPVMDQLAGFKLYLQTAESNRLNLQAPEITAERFEALLPYAVALDAEKPWSNAFAAALKRAHPEDLDPMRHYQSAWSSHSAWSGANFSNAVASTVASASSALSNSIPVSSASSGFSSGGGGSGGGGGGGGGGGW
ncbi:MAG: DUF2207 domain-containing protein [Desulfovibrionaceae bacterium]|jgi:uncharacterized membrane protein YgcG|nr:DUF2207 domain-containing protein [Desulfovibrionaceae bacterium]